MSHLARAWWLQGFSRGTSSFRGVTKHPSGRWESRIGVPGVCALGLAHAGPAPELSPLPCHVPRCWVGVKHRRRSTPRPGPVAGSKHVYLGLFEDDQAAARAYDRALVRLRGPQSATNFQLSEYRAQLAEYHHMNMVRRAQRRTPDDRRAGDGIPGLDGGGGRSAEGQYRLATRLGGRRG